MKQRPLTVYDNSHTHKMMNIMAKLRPADAWKINHKKLHTTNIFSRFTWASHWPQEFYKNATGSG